MKQKTSYTLAEILSVIVIICVILLIVTPIVSGALESKKQDAFLKIVNELLTQTNDYYRDSKPTTALTFDLSKDEIPFTINKEEIKGGTILIDENGQIAFERVNNGTYCASKKVNVQDIRIERCKVTNKPSEDPGDKDTPDVPLEKSYAKKTILEKESIKTTGDGLYQIGSKYYYRGDNPNNYIRFNNEIWRIISLEANDQLKIIRDDVVTHLPWDEASKRPTATNSYCTKGTLTGCNAWTMRSDGSVSMNATLNDYLNGEYYKNILNKENISKSNFYIGSLPYQEKDYTISQVIVSEQQLIWSGYIGLMNVSDYIYASLDDTCVQNTIGNVACKNHNWLADATNHQWTINSHADTTDSAYFIGTDGFAGITYADNHAKEYSGVRPVIYLKKSIQIKGNGTSTDPYELVV